MLTDEERERMLANAAALEAAGITDDEARNAIDGYLQAALFTAADAEGDTLEGLGLAWSEDAQRAARDTVIDFIVAHPNVSRAFAAHFGSDGWLQVGIDLCFTRNGEGAGFWSRAVPEHDRTPLTVAARELPTVHVFVNDEGELDFE